MVANAPITTADKEVASLENLENKQEAVLEEELETDAHQMDQQLQEAVQRAYSGEEAEEAGTGPAGDMEDNGEYYSATDADADGDNDESEPVGAVKLPDGSGLSDADDADYEPADEEAADPPYKDDDPDDQIKRSTSSSDSEAGEEEWEAESNNHEDGDDAVNTAPANCM